MLSFIAQALVADIGIRIPCTDPESTRQALERIIKKTLPARPPLSILTRQTAVGPEVWLVKTEFMLGKKLDEEKVLAHFKRQPPGLAPDPGDLPDD